MTKSPTISYHSALPARDELAELYESVGWSAYTKAMDALARALEGSAYVLLAREGEQLVGLARCISDDATVMLLQDILVNPTHHRRGIGRALMERCIERFEHVRQRILLTDDRPEQHAFYTSLGFSDVSTLKKHRLHAFVQYRGMSLE